MYYQNDDIQYKQNHVLHSTTTLFGWLSDIVGISNNILGRDRLKSAIIHKINTSMFKEKCSYLTEEILGNSTEQGTGRITSLLPTAGAGMERQMF